MAHAPMVGTMLAGKSALITGASRGIGAAIAEAFVAQGARVVLAARTLSDLEELADRLRAGGGEAIAVETDITDPAALNAAVARAVAAYGGLDIAVNNAGITQKRQPLVDTDPEVMARIMAVNVQSLFLAMQAQVRAMLANGGGAIVNVASVTSVAGVAQMPAYCASRHAILGLTRSTALEHARSGIRINAIGPGPVMTDMLRGGGAATPEGMAALTTAIPMGRIAEPHEMAGAVVFLASDAASFITGAFLPVDGGYLVP